MQSLLLVGWGRRVALLLGLVTLGSCSHPVNFAGLQTGEHRTKLHERILLQTLDNGLRLVVMPDYRSNLISIGVNYDVGAADDPQGGDGLAHYAEHVMFNAAFRGPDGPTLNEVGLYKNAWTVFDRTYFTLSALAVELDPALELTARRFETTCDDLDPAMLDRERDIVIEEAKLKASALDVANALSLAVWGPSSVYGHDAGGHGFASLPRPELCKFITDHYGPKSAVLVVTGNVSDADFQRIRRRLERIPTRPAVRSPAVPIATAPAGTTARFVLKEVERPTALLIFPAPGEGGTADAALAALDGHTWLFDRTAPNGVAVTHVIGEDRKRAILAIAETADAKQLDELASKMRQAFAKLKESPAELEEYRQHRRSALAASLDDPFASTEDIAVAVARGQQPTRFRALQQLSAVKPEDVTRWFDTSNVRTAYFLPEIGSHGKAHVGDVATTLHDVTQTRSAQPSNLVLPLPAARPKLDVVDSRLPNGLRVLLTRDPGALAMDARLVIAGTYDHTGTGIDLRAALLLTPEYRALTSDDERKLLWYSNVLAPVIGIAGEGSTTFTIQGLSDYADWHVWNLAWTVVHGTYSAELLDAIHRHTTRHEPRAPSSREIVRRRLLGISALPDGQEYEASADALGAFRDANYRPDRATLIVSGNFDLTAMQKEISTLFGEWKSGRGTSTAPSSRVGTAVAIDAPDEATLELTLAFAPSRPFGASDVAARAVLAELVNARVRTIRERLGASYGLNATASNLAIEVQGAVEPAYASEAFKAIADELARIRVGDPTLADELAHAKHTVLANALTLPAAASQRAAMLEHAVKDGIALDQLDAQIQAIRAVDLVAVQKLAASAMNLARMIAAVRGDHRAVAAALDSLGVAKTAIEWIGAPKSERQQLRSPEAPKVAGQ